MDEKIVGNWIGRRNTIDVYMIPFLLENFDFVYWKLMIMFSGVSLLGLVFPPPILNYAFHLMHNNTLFSVQSKGSSWLRTEKYCSSTIR